MSQVGSDELDMLSVEIEQGIRYVFDDTYMVDPALLESDPFMLAKLQRPIFVSEMTPSVLSYNQMALADGKIAVKSQFDETAIDANQWNIPDRYKNMTIADMLVALLERQEALGFVESGSGPRTKRIGKELSVYKQIDKLDMLRLMFYVVDVLTSTNQVWGVGRGSSVSSYVLFLIGVHDIDSFEYDLDFADFVKV